MSGGGQERSVQLLRSLARDLDRLQRANPGSLSIVRDANSFRVNAERLLAVVVDEARLGGCTWQEIGDVLGISRQGAFQRFGRPVDPRTGKPMDKTPLPDAVARALDIFGNITKARFAEACADFDETMTEKLPPQVLGDNWTRVIGQVGAYAGAGVPTCRRQAGLTVVDIPLEFEAGEFVGRVSFRPDGRVAGLFFLDPEYARQH
ncbi:hypothetical protein M2284_001501 [Rhodococcus sp. LBL1]|uniref:DUF3887 domain-containing protein n=1 Tax=Prescottella agglutinans TaxID=1644129 RepID=A0ABT6MJF0_9NOCA|nr:DUF3887 domain-containing protein [Prescottella agglutinans]MDH6283926.1 hypothetical protein [Prescottella agglutinans]MDH6677303.1 hypothetical protein [Rhodococcus sp. LBL1]MDH6682403.1 hypothetical protein [Rhodococcus sp. LBL2]